MNQEDHTPSLTALDYIANGSHLAMLKALVPFLAPSMQRAFAVTIKFMELGNILKFYDNPPELGACSLQAPGSTAADILQTIRCYLGPAEQESVDQCLNLMQTMELFQELQRDGGGEDLLRSMFETVQAPEKPDGERKENV
ncbi:MAG: hypothetical protein SOZ59_06490 [Candidatus Limivivens sp.]|nr:hypothetical protein [Candidatus Limivivens sp.]